MKVVLGYSGGLDTSVIVPWLRENYDADVICMAGDVGQRGDIRDFLFGRGNLVVTDQCDVLQCGAQTFDLPPCNGLVGQGIHGRDCIFRREARIIRPYFADVFYILWSLIIVG